MSIPVKAEEEDITGVTAQPIGDITCCLCMWLPYSLAMRVLRKSAGRVTFVLAVPSLLWATSCIYEYGDNCPDRLSLRIENDWHADSCASPEGMAYMFFPYEGGEPWRFDFPGREAGDIMLAPGRYAFVSHNDDVSNVMFADEGGYGEYEAYTSATGLLCGIPPSERGSCLPSVKDSDKMVVRCPDMLWGCAYGSVELHYDGVDFFTAGMASPEDSARFSPDFILTVYQRPLTAHYIFRIEDVENLGGVSSMSASLSGMAGSLFMASGEKGRYPSTLSLNAEKLGPMLVGGDFYTFGIPASPVHPNILSLFVVIKDGRRFCYEFDVTGQVRDAGNPMEVTIVIRGLSVEKPESGGAGGFDVSVDGWETVEVNIND